MTLGTVMNCYNLDTSVSNHNKIKMPTVKKQQLCNNNNTNGFLWTAVD